MKRKGFTLIELLVVVAILSVLSCFIMPVFGKARERAHETTTASECRQIFMAMIMYKSDTGKVPEDVYDLADYVPGINLDNYEINPDEFPVKGR